jgi:hypothetical protein
MAPVAVAARLTSTPLTRLMAVAIENTTDRNRISGS